MDRHGNTCATLIALFLACAVAHTIAVAKISVLNGVPLDSWPPRLIRNMAGIQFFEANWVLILPYLLLFFGALIYMEFRVTPRWVVWGAFAFLSLPLLGYLWTCVRFTISSIAIVGPVSGQ
jgi:hypothetical protein